MVNELIDACNPLWACIIKHIDFDIFQNRIVFDLLDAEHDLNHRLEMFDVYSYIWISRSGTPQRDSFEPIYNEFTSIVFRNAHIETKNDKWLSQYFLDYNVCVEIMDGALLINSKTLILNGRKFTLE